MTTEPHAGPSDPDEKHRSQREPLPDGGQSDETPTEEANADEVLQELERKRSMRGVAAIVVSMVGIAFSLFQLWIAARGYEFIVELPGLGEVGVALQQLQVSSIHVSFALILAFLLFPPSDGTGAIAKRLGQVVPAVRDRLGADNPLTRAAESVRGVVRWLAMDPERERVTPLDVVFIVVAAATSIYMVSSFKEIQRLRVFGLDAGKTFAEAFPFLSVPADLISALGIPMNQTSIAFFLGLAGVLLVLEATRRTLGLYLMIIVGSFIVYAKYGFLIPGDAPVIGILSTVERTSDWATIIQNLWYNTENGVFGIPVTVSVQFIYVFILFGAFLEMSGSGQWFIDLAYAATGTRKGGPAKASILASGFMGTISGSSIANTVTTGAFTIPLMKRTGYRSEFAGAVEASASSGGQILPPVMGAAAFLMIEYIGVPFSDIIIAAAIPAVVFFFGVWVMVHLEASRAGIGGLDASEVVSVGAHMRRGWFYLVPLALLLYYLLIERLTVSRSAWFTIVALVALLALVAAYNERTRLPLVGGIAALALAQFGAYLATGASVVGALTGEGGAAMTVAEAAGAAAGDLGTIVIFVSVAVMLARPNLDAPLLNLDDAVDNALERVDDSLRNNQPVRYGTFILKSMDDGARTATEVVIAVAAAGIIPGVVSATGLGPNLTELIKVVAGDSITLLLLFTAVACIILGMGMPTTVTYIILVSLLGDAIMQVSGGAIPLLAAHLFILYFGVIADITPPVAVAAYAASGIAKSDPFKTGVEAFSLSLNKAIVPFAFALTPGILLLDKTNQTGKVLSSSQLLDVGYSLPNVVIPVLGVFVGVVALGATVIGFLYAPVSRGERAGYAVSAFLLMAPIFVYNAVIDVSGLLGLGFTVGNLVVLDMAMRITGGVLFGVLALKNRRHRDEQPADAGTASEPTLD